jgi:hypothetical protein
MRKKLWSVCKSALLVGVFGCFLGVQPRVSRAQPSLYADDEKPRTAAELVAQVHGQESAREERRAINDVVSGCNKPPNDSSSSSSNSGGSGGSLGAAHDPQPSLKPDKPAEPISSPPDPSNTYDREGIH